MFYPKLGQFLRKLKKISWYIDHPSLLLRLQTSYFIKLSSLPELIFHPLSYNCVRIIQNIPVENSPTENFSSSNFTAESSPSGFYEGSPFYSGFFSKKALVWESRCRDWKKRVFCKTCFHCRCVIIPILLTVCNNISMKSVVSRCHMKLRSNCFFAIQSGNY